MANPSSSASGPPSVPVQQLISRAYLQWSYPVRYFDSWDAWKKGSGGGSASLPDHGFLTDTHFYVVKAINSECYRCVALDYIHTIWVRVQSGLMSERCTVVVSCTPAQHDILFDVKGKDLGSALHAALIKYGGRPETALNVVKTDLWKEPSIQLSPMHGYQLVWAPPSRRQDVKRYTIRLIRFYEYHCPEKLANIETILEAAEGQEEAVFARLVAKYGPEPPPLDYPTRLRRFYSKYCPEKIGSINTILEKAKGAEELIFSKLRAKYGQEPVEVDYSNVPDEGLVTKIKEFFLKRDPAKAEDQPACRQLAREFKNNEAALWAELERRCGPVQPSFSEYGEGDVMEIEPVPEEEEAAELVPQALSPVKATSQAAPSRMVDQRPPAVGFLAAASEREVGQAAAVQNNREANPFSSGPSSGEMESFYPSGVYQEPSNSNPAMSSGLAEAFTTSVRAPGDARQSGNQAPAGSYDTKSAAPAPSDRKPLRKPPPSIYFGKGRPDTVRILEGARQADRAGAAELAVAPNEKLTRKPTYVAADVDGKAQEAPGSYLKVNVEDRLLFGGGEAIRRIRSQKRFPGSPASTNPHFETTDAEGYDWEVTLDPSSEAAAKEYRQRLLEEDPGVSVLRGSELLPVERGDAPSAGKSLAAAETLKVQLKKELEEDDYFGLKQVLDLSPRRGLVFGAGDSSRRRPTAAAAPSAASLGAAQSISAGGDYPAVPQAYPTSAQALERSSDVSAKSTLFGRGRQGNPLLFSSHADETGSRHLDGAATSLAALASSQQLADQPTSPKRWLRDDSRQNPLSPATPTASLVQQMKWRALDSSIAAAGTSRLETAASYSGWSPALTSSTSAATRAKVNPADPSQLFPHSAQSANRSMAFLKEAGLRYEERLEELGRNPLAVPTLNDVLQHTERLSDTWQQNAQVGDRGFVVRGEGGGHLAQSMYDTSLRSLSSKSSPSPVRPTDRDDFDAREVAHSHSGALTRDPTSFAQFKPSLSVLEPLEFGSALL